MRLPLIAGNWKMNKTVGESVDFVERLRTEVAGVKNAEIIVCPPFTAIYEVARTRMGSNVGVGAQNVFWKTEGAYTGQISPKMLADAGCTYVIIGHSETRGRFGKVDADMPPNLLKYFAETDESVNLKLHAAFSGGLVPIVCVGETIDERKAGKTDDVIRIQVEKGLNGLTPKQAAGMVIAYEPVWAIGTGEVCDAAEANRVCGMIRGLVRSMFGNEAADGIRIQYGGSGKPDNAEELLSQPEIDGALVGGASLKVSDFIAIIRSV